MNESQRKEQKVRLLPNLLQAASDLAKMLATKRHYMYDMSDDDKNGSMVIFDPRFLVFEFTWNIVLRKAQVKIVKDFMDSLKQGKSKVKQMIMGAGKTTVVAPLLALMLANGDDLVLSVVPRALLEMSRKRMQETFSIIVQKRIYTLKFDRSTDVKPSLTQSLQNAVKNRGIVVATPTAIKSVFLSFIEKKRQLKYAMQNELSTQDITKIESEIKTLISTLKLFKTGVMLLDEVDL